MSWAIGKGNLKTTKENEKQSADQQIIEGKLNRDYWKRKLESHKSKNMEAKLNQSYWKNQMETIEKRQIKSTLLEREPESHKREKNC